MAKSVVGFALNCLPRFVAFYGVVSAFHLAQAHSLDAETAALLSLMIAFFWNVANHMERAQ